MVKLPTKTGKRQANLYYLAKEGDDLEQKEVQCTPIGPLAVTESIDYDAIGKYTVFHLNTGYSLAHLENEEQALAMAREVNRVAGSILAGCYSKDQAKQRTPPEVIAWIKKSQESGKFEPYPS